MDLDAASSSSSSSSSGSCVEVLPSALLASIFSKLDVPSICSMAATCRSFNSCVSNLLSFIPDFSLLDVALTVDLLRRLLPPNPHLRILKIDCGRLDDLAIALLARPSLHELCLVECNQFSGLLLSQIGEKCRDLRSLSIGSLGENKMRSIPTSDLEKLLSGCSQLEDSAIIVGVKGMFVDCSIGDALKFGSRRIFGVVIFIWLLLSLFCTLFCLWSSVSDYFGQ